jgi:hypothetical protein
MRSGAARIALRPVTSLTDDIAVLCPDKEIKTTSGINLHSPMPADSTSELAPSEIVRHAV